MRTINEIMGRNILSSGFHFHYRFIPLATQNITIHSTDFILHQYFPEFSHYNFIRILEKRLENLRLSCVRIIGETI